MKLTIKQIIEQHDKLVSIRKKEVERVEYLWNVKDYPLEYIGELKEIDKEINDLLAIEIELP